MFRTNICVSFIGLKDIKFLGDLYLALRPTDSLLIVQTDKQQASTGRALFENKHEFTMFVDVCNQDGYGHYLSQIAYTGPLPSQSAQLDFSTTQMYNDGAANPLSGLKAMLN